MSQANGEDLDDVLPRRSRWNGETTDIHHSENAHSRLKVTTHQRSAQNVCLGCSARLQNQNDSVEVEQLPPWKTPLRIDTSVPWDSLTPFNYHLALRNRLPIHKITVEGPYDTHAYCPIFLHDCLMLPGSLASLLNKTSPQDIIRRMTPALLAGHSTRIHAETQQPCLVESARPFDYVQGMVILGQGKRARACIDAHYRPLARRTKVKVEIEVTSASPLTQNSSPHMTEFNKPLRRWTVKAQCWMWVDSGEADRSCASHMPKWNIDDYLAGTFDPKLGLQTTNIASGDEDEQERRMY